MGPVPVPDTAILIVVAPPPATVTLPDFAPVVCGVNLT